MYSTSIELLIGMVVCMLPYNPIGLVSFDPKCSNLVFFGFSIYFVSTTKLYFLLFLCIMPLIQFNAFFNHG